MDAHLPRILFVNSTFPPHTLGGGPQLASWITESLREAGHEVEILCANISEPTPPNPHVHRRLKMTGDWATGRRSGFADRIAQCFSYCADRNASAELYRDFAPNVMIAEAFFNISHAPWTVADSLEIPTIYLPVSSYSPNHIFQDWGRLEKLIFPFIGWHSPRPPDLGRLAALAAPSEHLLSDYISHGIRAPIERTIPLGIPTSRFCPGAAAKTRDGGSPFRILWLSRIVRKKGYVAALDAFIELKRDFGDQVELTISGFSHPADEAEFTRIVGEKGLTNSITRLTIPPEGEDLLIDTYRSHDVYWFTSEFHEALTLSLIEALACALPVIGVNRGGNASIFEKSGGTIEFEAGDHMALAARTAELMRDPARRRMLGESGSRFILAHHSQKVMGEKLSALVQEVVERN